MLALVAGVAWYFLMGMPLAVARVFKETDGHFSQHTLALVGRCAACLNH